MLLCGSITIVTELNRKRFRIPTGVDRVISVRPRWVGPRGGLEAGYMVIRIWYDGRVEDVAGPLAQVEALDMARATADAERTVYMRAPDDQSLGSKAALFGEVPGVVPGQRFRRRADLRAKGLVRVLQQGIDSSPEGALAVVFSGGYADDDWSEDPWYTGEGGQDEPGGHQVRDQELLRGNLALMRNLREGLPVRVVRRVTRHDGDHEFVYEGLFHVVDYMYGPGREGPKVYRFRLRRL